MSTISSHLSLEELVAAATGRSLAPAAAGHLADCATCAGEFGGWSSVADGVHALLLQAEPPPDLISNITATAGAHVDRPGPAVADTVITLWHQARTGGRSRRLALLASAAVVVAAAGGYGVSTALPTAGGRPIASQTATPAALSSTGCHGLKAVGGTLRSVSGMTLVIKTSAGRSVPVTVSSGTKVVREVTGSAVDITNGAEVTVHGSPSGGTIDATLVAIVPGTAPSIPKLPSGLGNGSLRLGFASGRIANASSSRFTLDEADGSRVRVSLSKATSIVAIVKSSLSQLQTGKLTSAVGTLGSHGKLAAAMIEQDAIATAPALPGLPHSLPTALPGPRRLGHGLPAALPSLPAVPSGPHLGPLFSGLGCSQSAIVTTDLAALSGS